MAVMHIQRNPKRQRSNMYNDSHHDRYVDYINQDSDDYSVPWKQGGCYPKGPMGLHTEIKDFYHFIRPTVPEFAMREDVVMRLRKCVKNLWPDAEVEVFGSSQTQLFLPTSDIDMVVIGNWPVPPLRSLEKALNSCNYIMDIKVLDNATVPIVKLTDAVSRVSVDISFNMRNGIRAANLINGYIKDYPALPPLVMLLKQFLLQRGLNEVFSGGLSSYALTLMIVSFLQLHPREDARSENPNLGVLLIEFFELYGHKFKYATTAIRVGTSERPAAYIPKEDVIDGGCRPRTSILCIEDPLQPGNDVARSSYAVLQVKHAFEYAYLLLHSTMIEQDRPRSNAMRSDSVLSKLVCFPSIMINYRNWIVRQYTRSHFYKLGPNYAQPPIYYHPSSGMQFLSMFHLPYPMVPSGQPGTVTPESGVCSTHSGAMSTTGDEDEDDEYSSDYSNMKKDSDIECEKVEEEEEDNDESSPSVPSQGPEGNTVDRQSTERVDSSVPSRTHSTSHQSSTDLSSISSASQAKGVPQSISEPVITSSPLRTTTEVAETIVPVPDDTTSESSYDPSSPSAYLSVSTERQAVLPPMHFANTKPSYASVARKNPTVDRNGNECRQSVGSSDDSSDQVSISSTASQPPVAESYLSPDLDVKASPSQPSVGDQPSNASPVATCSSSDCRRAASSCRRNVFHDAPRRRSPSLPPHSTSSRDSQWQQQQRRRRKRTTYTSDIPQVSSTINSAR